MSKMKLRETEGTSSYHAKVEHWTSREMQLNVLHVEIIHKREALLRMSRNLLHSTAREELQLNNTEASARNERLIKDIRALEEYLAGNEKEAEKSRFTNLQANYKSMVENMYPIWQKSLQELQVGSEGSTRKDN